MFNVSMIIGEVVRTTPERSLPSGSRTANMTVRTWRERDDKTFSNYHTVSVWGKAVDFVGKVNAGDLVEVRGEKRDGKWTDKEGNVRYTSEIVADRIDFFNPVPPPTKAQVDAATPKSDQPADDDSIPF